MLPWTTLKVLSAAWERCRWTVKCWTWWVKSSVEKWLTASPQVCFFIFVPPPGPPPLHCDLVMSLYAHRHYRKNTTFVTLLLCGGLVVITYIQLLGWAVLKGNGGYKAWYTLATKSNSIRLTLLKVDCCWNWQQSRLLPDTFSFVVDMVDFVVDTVDFVYTRPKPHGRLR